MTPTQSPRRPRGRALTLAAVLSLSLTACGQDTQTPGTDDGRPVSGGTLTYAVESEPSCLDPHVSMADMAAVIGRGVYDSLVAQDTRGAIHPWLATSWRVAPDLRSYTFELRTDVRFHDGTPFNAAAVKANFDRIAAPSTRSQYASTLLGPYAGTTVLDDRTVRVDFTRPFAPFLQAASTTYLGMASPKALTEHAGSLCGRLVGSGPFVFERHVRQQSVELRRNPDYNWAPPTAKHAGPAYLDRLVIRIIPESATRLGALTSGQMDAISAVPPADVATVRADPSLQLHATPIQGITYGLYLNTAKPPFNDPRVRIALQRGIDIEGVVRSVYFGQYQRAWSMLSPNTPHYDPATERSWTQDQALANRLLDEAGWTARDAEGYRTRDGVRLSARWPYTQAQAIAGSRGTLAQAVQAEAKKLGIEIQRPSMQTGPLLALTEKGDYEILDTNWTRADPDILRGFLTSDNMPLRGQNYARVSNPELDAWLNRAASTSDEAARRDGYARAQQWALREAIVIPVHVPTYLLGAKRQVRGLNPDPAAFPLFHDMWLVR